MTPTAWQASMKGGGAIRSEPSNEALAIGIGDDSEHS
jgi:hypothetical protein